MFLLLQESLQASYWNANKYERASSKSIYVFVCKLWDSSKAFMRGFFIFLASKTAMKKSKRIYWWMNWSNSKIILLLIFMHCLNFNNDSKFWKWCNYIQLSLSTLKIMFSYFINYFIICSRISSDIDFSLTVIP